MTLKNLADGHLGAKIIDYSSCNNKILSGPENLLSNIRTVHTISYLGMLD